MTLPMLRRSADGWRGRIGAEFTPASAAALARTITCVVGRSRPTPRVVVTHDGRRDGAAAAAAVAAGVGALTAHPVPVVAHLPTPTASRYVQRGLADLVFSVTASHNPADWNGVKAKVAPGSPLPREAEAAVAAASNGGHRNGPPTVDTAPAPDVLACDALVDEHLAFACSVSPAASTAAGTAVRTVVVDGLHGIAGEPMSRLCRRLGLDVVELGCEPDEGFGGCVPDPTVTHSRERAAREVRASGAAFGLVLDGDGDRVYVLDDHGAVVQPHELFALLLTRVARPAAPASIAVTAATGSAARSAARRLGLGVSEQPVGFKHLAPLLSSGAVTAACGAVGDLAFAPWTYDRDPFVAVAMLVGLLRSSPRPLHELVREQCDGDGALYWFESRIPAGAARWSLEAAGSAALHAVGLEPTAVTHVDGVKFWLGAGQWALLRESSTEGGTRLYCELLGSPSAGAAEELSLLIENNLNTRST